MIGMGLLLVGVLVGPTACALGGGTPQSLTYSMPEGKDLKFAAAEDGDGWVLDRLDKNEYFIGAGGLFVALLFVVIAGDYRSYLLLLILLGVFSALVPAPTLSLPPKLVAPLYLGLAFGIVQSLSNVGRVIFPYFIGLARDYTGNYRAAFFMMAMLSLGGAINAMLITLRGRGKKGP